MSAVEPTVALATAPRANAAGIAGTICLATMSVVTAVSLCRVFSDWDYLAPMLVMLGALHLASLVLRMLRVRGIVAIPLLFVLVAILTGLLYYRASLSFGLPTGQTLDSVRVDARLVFRQFATAVAPVPSHGSFATATAVALGLCVVLSDAFAFRAQGRVEPVVPCGVLFVFAAALGTERQRVLLTVVWIGVALLAIAVLRFAHTSGGSTWMGSRAFTLWAALPAMILTVALSAAAAAAIAPHLPGAGQKALIDTRNRDGTVTEVLSPLVDIRARMRNRGNSELFRAVERRAALLACHLASHLRRRRVVACCGRSGRHGRSIGRGTHGRRTVGAAVHHQGTQGTPGARCVPGHTRVARCRRVGERQRESGIALARTADG